MGLSFSLIGFPLIVLTISILMSGGGIAGPGTNVAFNQNPSATNGPLVAYDCTGFTRTILGGTPCFQGSSLPTNAQIFCGGSIGTSQPCYILNVCPSGLQTPLYCNTILQNTFQDVQSTAVITSGQITDTTGSSVFQFGSIGLSGFIPWILIAVATAAIVGLNIFGSGESSEAIHILFIGGIGIAFWVFLSALEGFINGSSASFFVQLNGAFSNLGTTLYAFLTMVYSIGVVKTVSRGS